jgi:hypothetical protein
VNWLKGNEAIKKGNRHKEIADLRMPAAPERKRDEQVAE